jgi:hypothetical protein
LPKLAGVQFSICLQVSERIFSTYPLRKAFSPSMLL